MQKTKLARLLGVSRETVHRLVKRGMPSDSLSNAIEWRAKNLDIRQTIQGRITGNSGGKRSGHDSQSQSHLKQIEFTAAQRKRLLKSPL